jgi:hypothetical protein
MSFPFLDFGSAPPFQQVFDYVARTDGQPVYAGMAVCGVATSDCKWRIRRLTYDTNSQVLTIKFANGDPGFRAIWDNRTTLTYS